MFETLFRHRSISLPLVMVLLLDLSLLGINFHISSQLEADSININIAGRQRMLSQRIAKNVMLFPHRTGQHREIDSLITELGESQALFSETLQAFREGGMATSASGADIRINRLKQPQAIKVLSQAESSWLPIDAVVSALLKSPNDRQTMMRAITVLEENNNALLDLMNTLTITLENDATRKTYLLRLLQTLIVLLILGSFTLASIRVIQRERYYNRLMEHSTDVVLSIDLDSKTVTFVSQSVIQLLGRPQQHYLGDSAIKLFHPISHHYIDDLLNQVATEKKIQGERHEVQLINAKGEAIFADMVIQLSRSEDGKRLELNADLRDISERKLAEIQLAELAHKDPLTQLPNRILFYELAEQSIKDARRNQSQFAIMFIDIDGFKLINDNFGHNCGDLMLVSLADNIKSCVRESDTVARIGGDEFIVLLRETADQADIERIGQKIIAEISAPKMLLDNQCQVGASIGVALYPHNGESIDSLVNSADGAMYRIKNGQKNGLAFAMNDRA